MSWWTWLPLMSALMRCQRCVTLCVPETANVINCGRGNQRNWVQLTFQLQPEHIPADFFPGKAVTTPQHYFTIAFHSVVSQTSCVVHYFYLSLRLFAVQGEVVMDGGRHVLFAMSAMLGLLGKARRWYVDGRGVDHRGAQGARAPQ